MSFDEVAATYDRIAGRQRLRELNRRMAELKGSGGNPLRPGA